MDWMSFYFRDLWVCVQEKHFDVVFKGMSDRYFLAWDSPFIGYTVYVSKHSAKQSDVHCALWSHFCKEGPKWNHWLRQWLWEGLNQFWCNASSRKIPGLLGVLFVVLLQNMTVLDCLCIRLNITTSGHDHTALFHIISESKCLGQNSANTVSSQTSISKHCCLKILFGFCGWLIRIMETRSRFF